MAVVPITDQTSRSSQEKISQSPDKAPSSRSGPPSTDKKTSPSRKSVSVSNSRHRLKKTLKRKPEFHPIEDGDLKYLWAAYKLGSFGEPEDITQDEFRYRTGEMLNLTDITYTLVAKTSKGKIPVGLFSTRYNGPLLFMVGVKWFKWASLRNKIETMTHILNELRKEYIVLMFPDFDKKKFYELIAKHGVIRRIGTLNDLYENGPSPVFHTRKR
jgi:hypothetical protein